MLSEVNYLAVVAAAGATMALGGIWYGPLFGSQWMAARGSTPEPPEKMRAGIGRAYGLSFVCYLAVATVLAYLLLWIGAASVPGALWLAFLCWLGFVATTGATALLFSDRKPVTYLIEAAYQLAYMLLMGAILGAWR